MMKYMHHYEHLEYLDILSHGTYIFQIPILQEDTHDHYD